MIALRALCAPLVLFFVYAAWVQLNDPDPMGWIAIYGSAAALAVVQMVRPVWQPCAALVVAALAYAASLLPAWVREGTPAARSFFDQELNRELMGLLIVAISFTMVSLLAHRANARRTR